MTPGRFLKKSIGDLAVVLTTSTVIAAAVSTTVVAATVSTASATVSASAATGGTLFTRASNVHGKAPAGKILAVHAGDCRIGLFRARHGHECEAA